MDEQYFQPLHYLLANKMFIPVCFPWATPNQFSRLNNFGWKPQSSVHSHLLIWLSTIWILSSQNHYVHWFSSWAFSWVGFTRVYLAGNMSLIYPTSDSWSGRCLLIQIPDPWAIATNENVNPWYGVKPDRFTPKCDWGAVETSWFRHSSLVWFGFNPGLNLHIDLMHGNQILCKT